MTLANDVSPFHAGERAIQEKLGVRDKMEQFGQRVIREYLPQQHRDFYTQLPFVFVGHADHEAWPWASLLYGDPGFMHSPDDKTLLIDSNYAKGDPLVQSLKNRTHALPLGMLGIELPSRRRNRLSAQAMLRDDGVLECEVDQTFGNCPQYIQARHAKPIERDHLPEEKSKKIHALDDDAVRLISQTDTFFVASFVKRETHSISEGVDVSHRGGQPGFVRVDDSMCLTIPDFAGNNHFNTLGNFALNPKAGLLFLDFKRHHLLTLTGRVEILWDHPDQAHFDGAHRLWRFHLDHGYWLYNSLQFEWSEPEPSINNSLTGNWKQASQRQQAETYRNTWLAYKIQSIERETPSVKSFYLSPVDKNFTYPSFKAGQFLRIKVTNKDSGVFHHSYRHYSLSCAPDDDFLRISVKRHLDSAESQETSANAEGHVSHILHDQLNEGDQLEIQSAQGAFTLDHNTTRPAVLIAAGIGMTPMISMLRDAVFHLVKMRTVRPMICFFSVKNLEERIFYDEIASLRESLQGQLRVVWCLTQESDRERNAFAGSEDSSSLSDHYAERLSKAILQMELPLDDYDFFVCGPSDFMQDTYRSLRDLSVADDRIFAEAFGPAGLKRDHLSSTDVSSTVARHALIKFENQQGQFLTELAWQENDGYLLDFAESHGLNPAYSCRAGQCGACQVTVKSGKLVHEGSDLAKTLADDQALLCCAKPARNDELESQDATPPDITLIMGE